LLDHKFKSAQNKLGRQKTILYAFYTPLIYSLSYCVLQTIFIAW